MEDNKPKILVWDLETTDFNADFGHILTAAAVWVNHDYIYSWKIDDHPDYGTTPESMINDKWIAEQLREMIAESDLVVHHYGDKFDLPFLNTRLMAWGLEPCPQVKTIDTWKVARSTLKLGRNSLANVAEFLNDEDAQKGHVPKSKWKLASHGDKKVLYEILAYNIADVIATEQAYLKLRPLIKSHPYVAKPVEGKEPKLQCPACGSYKSKSTGSYYTKLFVVKRRRCKDCGTPWEESRSKK